MLRASIDRLTSRLCDQLTAVRVSEQRALEQNETLERRVFERARELDEANPGARLYIDILLHDIGRALGPTRPRAASLAAGIDGDQALDAGRVAEAIRQCTRILECAAWVDRSSHPETSLAQTDLARAVRDGIARHPDPRVRFDGTDERVLADGFLPEIFANLLGDSRHYGGSGVNCRVRVESRGDGVLVSLEDDGPGIPDREKERLFARPARKGDGRCGGAGPGPFHRRRAGPLVRWPDPGRGPAGGDHARGSQIRLTLRRAVPGADSPAREEGLEPGP